MTLNLTIGFTISVLHERVSLAMGNRLSSDSDFNADEDIRLFRVRTSFRHRGRMSIDIIRVKLSNPVPYIAISYEWGSNQVVSRINGPNGGQIDLTESAYDIIEYVIKKRRRRDWVWMDSVCIDQKNQAEKRRQFALMGKIYSSASQVFACIGPELYGGDEALRFLPKVFKILKEYEQSGNMNKMAIAQRLQNLGLYGWTALWSVLRSSFFERMWIVQEMIMAPSQSLLPEKDKGVMITSFKEDVAFVILIYVAVQLRKLGRLAYLTIPDDDKSLPQTLLCAQNIGAFRQRRSNLQSISVEYALCACVHYKAKYGVDKIYAVMNFVQDDQLIDDLRVKFTEPFYREEDAIRLTRAEEYGGLRSGEEDASIRKLRDEEDSKR